MGIPASSEEEEDHVSTEVEVGAPGTAFPCDCLIYEGVKIVDGFD